MNRDFTSHSSVVARLASVAAALMITLTLFVTVAVGLTGTPEPAEQDVVTTVQAPAV